MQSRHKKIRYIDVEFFPFSYFSCPVSYYIFLFSLFSYPSFFLYRSFCLYPFPEMCFLFFFSSGTIPRVFCIASRTHCCLKRIFSWTKVKAVLGTWNSAARSIWKIAPFLYFPGLNYFKKYIFRLHWVDFVNDTISLEK